MGVFSCAICPSNTTNGHLVAMDENGCKFSYNFCANCGCLELDDPDLNDDQYYDPDDYPTFRETPPDISARLANRLVVARDSYALWRSPRWGALLLPMFPDSILASLRPLGVQRSSRILDVGCGTGDLIRRLRYLGIQDSYGIAPFARFSPDPALNGAIGRDSIDALGGIYNFVIFNHSLEHIPDQIGTLENASRLVGPNGYVIVRLPVQGWSSKHYSYAWGQLDPPRHRYLHTRRRVQLMAERSGLDVNMTIEDSNWFQFAGGRAVLRSGSTLVAQEKPLLVRAGYQVAWFPPAFMANAWSMGDQALFVLKPKRART
jgi:SAM-dependent methyltransferase